MYDGTERRDSSLVRPRISRRTVVWVGGGEGNFVTVNRNSLRDFTFFFRIFDESHCTDEYDGVQ